MLITLSLLFSLAQGCATLGDLSGTGSSSERVEKFPEGEQVNTLIGGFFSGLKDVNVETRVFDAPYDKVWSAAKLSADKLDKIGKRPLVLIDEKNGRLSNGVIAQNALIGLGGGAWADEFQIEVTSVSDNKTKVNVARKVVEKEFVTLGGARRGIEGNWKSQWSNGNIEKWILAQIEDQLTNQASGQKAERAPLPKPGSSSEPLPKREAAPTTSSLAPKVKPEAEIAAKTPASAKTPVEGTTETNASKGGKNIEMTSGKQIIITVKKANLRENPEVKSKMVASASKDEKYPLLNTVTISGQQWYQIRLADGRTAWVLASLSRIME